MRVEVGTIRRFVLEPNCSQRIGPKPTVTGWVQILCGIFDPAHKILGLEPGSMCLLITHDRHSCGPWTRVHGSLDFLFFSIHHTHVIYFATNSCC
jgi:hypothetical protein